LRVTRSSRENEIGVIDVIMTEAVVVAIQDDPPVLGNNIDQRCEVGFIGS
jgi:hypothetical protein